MWKVILMQSLQSSGFLCCSWYTSPCQMYHILHLQTKTLSVFKRIGRKIIIVSHSHVVLNVEYNKIYFTVQLILGCSRRSLMGCNGHSPLYNDKLSVVAQIMSYAPHTWSLTISRLWKPLSYGLPAVFELTLTMSELTQKTVILSWAMAVPTSLWEFSFDLSFHHWTHHLTST